MLTVFVFTGPSQRTNQTWSRDEKDHIINFMIDNRNKCYRNKKSIQSSLDTLQIDWRTQESIAKQAFYMISKVKLIFKARNMTGQGATEGQIHGIKSSSTYGYDRILPLVCGSVALPLPNNLTVERGISTASQQPPSPEMSTPSTSATTTVEEQIAPQSTPRAKFQRPPRRLPECASLLVELRNLQDQQERQTKEATDLRRLELEEKIKYRELEEKKLAFEEKKLAQEKWIKEREFELARARLN